jgi:hypothetical protein
MMLWSGDCRPGLDALRLCGDLGVENMNAGNVHSTRDLGLVSSAPSHTRCDGEIQVRAASRNEFVCASERRAPFFESSDNVIAAYQRTGAPRRLEPVNALADFHAASYLSSIKALEKVFGWCSEQPLHAITARQYAQSVRDAASTQVFRLGPERWLVSNNGQVRTLRLPDTAHDPDMTASKGLTGWIRQEGALYVHTRGDRIVELALNSRPLPHLRLAECSAEIDFHVLAPRRAEFRVKDLRPVHAAFAGVPPQAPCELVVNGQSMHVKSDDRGVISLQLPAMAEVTLNFSTARLARQN